MPVIGLCVIAQNDFGQGVCPLSAIAVPGQHLVVRIPDHQWFGSRESEEIKHLPEVLSRCQVEPGICGKCTLALLLPLRIETSLR